MLRIKVNSKEDYSIAHTEEGWTINDIAASLDVQYQPNGLISVLLNGRSYTAMVVKADRKAKELTLNINGQNHHITVKEPIDQLLASMGLDMAALKKAEPVKAPMPGLVLKVLVTPGQQVNKGDGLLILEAMKMENVLKAGGPATVKAIKVDERTAVEKGTILIEME
ncbi:MAG: biotin/lipoyl-binding protein [Flavipsychrobacter sp.]|nr:biotin/lipoyl-binding protein [Flavipsychrobacter sp.]